MIINKTDIKRFCPKAANTPSTSTRINLPDTINPEAEMTDKINPE
jgi:hypothetical protein